MFIKVPTDIYIQVKDEAQAEEAARTIDAGLARQMDNFPEGDVIQTDVPGGCEVLTDEQIAELGFEE